MFLEYPVIGQANCSALHTSTHRSDTGEQATKWGQININKNKKAMAYVTVFIL